MTDRAAYIAPSMLLEFEQALATLPDGYLEGRFRARTWSVTIRRSVDGKRIWLYGSELGGKDFVSFNLYRLSTKRLTLKPCEMSSTKVIDFLLGFKPVVLAETHSGSAPNDE